jgi:hypothetical protein
VALFLYPRMQERPYQVSDAFAKTPRRAAAYESGGKPLHSKWAVPSAEILELVCLQVHVIL